MSLAALNTQQTVMSFYLATGKIVRPGNIAATAAGKYGHLNGLNQSYDNFRFDLTNILSGLVRAISNVQTFYILILAFTKLKMASSSFQLIISVFLSH